MGNCLIKVLSNVPTLENLTEPAMSDNNRTMVVSFPSQGPLESSIHIGERLTVLLDDGDFWMVQSTTTGNESYIPSNYTAKVINRWQYNDISRKKAEELLLLPHNRTGAFLIRKSQTNTETYSLSVLVMMDSYLVTVKHYRICCLQNGQFYISPPSLHRLTFYSLGQLVEHYSESADGLCCLLREPCIIQGSNNTTMATRPKAIRRPTLNWNDAYRWQYNDISRKKAEELLLLPHNRTGAFLIRKSQTNTETYSLSVLVMMDSYLVTVKHYRICCLQNGQFYISPPSLHRLTFYSLGQLVEHYSESADGLCCLLREPCIIQGSNNTTMATRPKAIRRPTLNWNDAYSSMIFSKARVQSEDYLVSEGLREAISSYLYITEASCQNCGKHWDA